MTVLHSQGRKRPGIAVIDPSLFTLPYDTAFCEALTLHGYDVTLYGRAPRHLEAAPEQCRFNPFFYRVSELLRAGIPNKAFQAVKGLEHWSDMTRLARFLTRQRPLAVHFQWAPLPVVDFAAVRKLRRRGIPVVLTIHDIKPFNDSPGSRLQRIGSTGIWRDFNHLIVHSESSKAALVLQGFGDDRISVIPHGVLSTRRGQADAATCGDQVNVLLFGKIKTYKGIDVMIEALGQMAKDVRRKCRVQIVGEPTIPMVPLQSRAAELGVAECISWDLRYVSAEEMSALLARADILCFPYREIDTSGVLMSSLRYGKPVVASNIGAFANLIRDGVHGYLVPVADSNALALALEALIDRPDIRLAFGQNVAALANSVPSWHEITARTACLYNRLVRGERGQPTELDLPP